MLEHVESASGMGGRSVLLLRVGLAGTAGCTGSSTTDQPTATGERLVIASEYAEGVTVGLVEDPRGEVVLSRTYPPGATATLEEEFEPGVAYRVVVLAGEETAWNRTVYDHESYELTVSESGHVDVESHAEA